MSEEITKQDIIDFLNERNTKYKVLDIIGDIGLVVRGDTFTQEELISVNCEVLKSVVLDTNNEAVSVAESLVRHNKSVCVNKGVLENYIKEKNAITWYNEDE